MPNDPHPIPELGNPLNWLSDSYNASYPAILVNLDSTNMFGNNRPCRTWIDYIKLLALQFGAIIGVMDYGKVYFVKRFAQQTQNPIEVGNKILKESFVFKQHLSALRGVVINNHWNGERTFEYGEVERTSNGDYVYENRVKTIDTFIGSYQEGGGSGTSIYTLIYYPPCNTYYLL
jgi:hypothetical protein